LNGDASERSRRRCSVFEGLQIILAAVLKEEATMDHIASLEAGEPKLQVASKGVAWNSDKVEFVIPALKSLRRMPSGHCARNRVDQEEM
jgi:hypothetical protein